MMSTCSIFCTLIIVLELVIFFRCLLWKFFVWGVGFSTLWYFPCYYEVEMFAWLSFSFMSAKFDHSIQIKDDKDDKLNFIFFRNDIFFWIVKVLISKWKLYGLHHEELGTMRRCAFGWWFFSRLSMLWLLSSSLFVWS